jgi:hypothetical protein
MIWALLAWYFFSGVAGTGAVLTSAEVADLQERAAVVVGDAPKRRFVQETLGDLHSAAKNFEKSFARSGRQLNRLYEDHADNRDEARAILDGLNREWEAGQAHALDARYALRDKLTEAEWAALFGSDPQSTRHDF